MDSPEEFADGGLLHAKEVNAPLPMELFPCNSAHLTSSRPVDFHAIAKPRLSWFP